MSKVIVLEPFSDWFVTAGEKPYLARKSDRHLMKVEFRNSLLFVILQRNNDYDHELRCYDKEDLATAVQFVDKYIDQNYLPAEDASRILRETDAREKSLHLQIAELQAAAIGQA